MASADGSVEHADAVHPAGWAGGGGGAGDSREYGFVVWHVHDAERAVLGGQLPLKLFNNYVRWVWVYVQYLKQDGTNLSVDAGATCPNTPNARSVGLLPQVFTLLGVPIWDTNTITPTLTFPTDATRARILYAGLGNSAADGGWRQYFPADAYPANQYAPQKEVLLPALFTGIFTLGLNLFALVTDLDIATTWAAIGPGVRFRTRSCGVHRRYGADHRVHRRGGGRDDGGGGRRDLRGHRGEWWLRLEHLEHSGRPGSIIPKILFNPTRHLVLEAVAVIV